MNHDCIKIQQTLPYFLLGNGMILRGNPVCNSNGYYFNISIFEGELSNYKNAAKENGMFLNCKK